jgi:hypothetical protein
VSTEASSDAGSKSAAASSTAFLEFIHTHISTAPELSTKRFLMDTLLSLSDLYFVISCIVLLVLAANHKTELSDRSTAT